MLKNGRSWLRMPVVEDLNFGLNSYVWSTVCGVSSLGVWAFGLAWVRES